MAMNPKAKWIADDICQIVKACLLALVLSGLGLMVALAIWRHGYDAGQASGFSVCERLERSK